MGRWEKQTRRTVASKHTKKFQTTGAWQIMAWDGKKFEFWLSCDDLLDWDELCSSKHYDLVMIHVWTVKSIFGDILANICLWCFSPSCCNVCRLLHRAKFVYSLQVMESHYPKILHLLILVNLKLRSPGYHMIHLRYPNQNSCWDLGFLVLEVPFINSYSRNTHIKAI